MRIAVAPASAKTAAAAIRRLLAAPEPVEVRALYRNLGRVPTALSSNPRFRAVRADVSDPLSLDFAGCDAVLAVTPPVYDGRDVVANAEAVSNNVKDAIARSGSVKRLVLLSSSGAQFSKGVGEMKTNNAAERIFTDTDIPAVIFVRCAYFMENWTANLDTLRAPKPFFYSTVTPLDWKMPMVPIDDIGSTLASQLIGRTMPALKPHIFELHGPRLYTPLDVQQAFCSALRKQVAIKPVERAELDAFFSRIFPPQSVGEWVEMATCFLPGGVMAADSINYDDVLVQRGTTELVDAIKSAVDVGFERA
ncbi:hypothetical protein CDD80_424 [Ophiocordyceps camponoti-rufipedis]|uniref:NAD(P)-binding domain-containing protein n=1 Tax=Ophiocordyceps camponoti-rufipedis TaxID=2004952 RepID=A0A2C5Z999_9HYPO|nr:hypothetical protein CDD80_424 [Ophiocordyceps camponoti-rufipedis]